MLIALHCGQPRQDTNLESTITDLGLKTIMWVDYLSELGDSDLKTLQLAFSWPAST